MPGGNAAAAAWCTFMLYTDVRPRLATSPDAALPTVINAAVDGRSLVVPFSADRRCRRRAFAASAFVGSSNTTSRSLDESSSSPDSMTVACMPERTGGACTSLVAAAWLGTVCVGSDLLSAREGCGSAFTVGACSEESSTKSTPLMPRSNVHWEAVSPRPLTGTASLCEPVPTSRSVAVDLAAVALFMLPKLLLRKGHELSLAPCAMTGWFAGICAVARVAALSSVDVADGAALDAPSSECFKPGHMLGVDPVGIGGWFGGMRAEAKLSTLVPAPPIMPRTSLALMIRMVLPTTGQVLIRAPSAIGGWFGGI